LGLHIDKNNLLIPNTILKTKKIDIKKHENTFKLDQKKED
jgi:hypothetical protein